MVKLKKIWLFLLGIMVIFWFNLQFTQWYHFRLRDNQGPSTQWLNTRDHRNKGWSQSEDRTSNPIVDNQDLTKEDPTWLWSESIWNKIMWIIHIPQKIDYETELWYVLALIKIVINRILWMLAFVALIYMLYCGFLVLSSWSDNKSADKGKKWMKNAAIAIAWLGLAWLIVSIMIWFIKVISRS